MLKESTVPLRMLLAGLLLAVSAVIAHAQAPAADDDEQLLNEVFQTDLVYPQDRGEVQITIGPRHMSNGDDADEIGIEIEYGITDKWEVFGEWDPFTRVRLDSGDTVKGPGDVELGTQYSFMHIHGTNNHVAIGVSVDLPTGSIDKGLTEGLVEINPYLALAHDFPGLHRMQLFGSIGVNLVHRARTAAPVEGDDEDAADEPIADPHDFLLNIGCFVPVRKIRFTAEWNWVNNQWNNAGTNSEIYATPGIVWVPSRHWEFGVGVPIGLTRDSSNAQIVGTIIYEFDTRHDKE